MTDGARPSVRKMLTTKLHIIIFHISLNINDSNQFLLITQHHFKWSTSSWNVFYDFKGQTQNKLYHPKVTVISYWVHIDIFIITSLQANVFSITGPLWGASTSQQPCIAFMKGQLCWAWICLCCWSEHVLKQKVELLGMLMWYHHNDLQFLSELIITICTVKP